MKKKIFLLILPFFCVALNLKAQKFGYIDTEYITSKMPEYQTAQAEIEKLTTKWIKEVSDKNDEVVKLEKSYRAEEILLTEEAGPAAAASPAAPCRYRPRTGRPP